MQISYLSILATVQLVYNVVLLLLQGCFWSGNVDYFDYIIEVNRQLSKQNYLFFIFLTIETFIGEKNGS